MYILYRVFSSYPTILWRSDSFYSSLKKSFYSDISKQARVSLVQFRFTKDAKMFLQIISNTIFIKTFLKSSDLKCAWSVCLSLSLSQAKRNSLDAILPLTYKLKCMFQKLFELSPKPESYV